MSEGMENDEGRAKIREAIARATHEELVIVGGPGVSPERIAEVEAKLRPAWAAVSSDSSAGAVSAALRVFESTKAADEIFLVLVANPDIPVPSIKALLIPVEQVTSAEDLKRKHHLIIIVMPGRRESLH